MYFETWALVFMGLGLMSFGILIGMILMSVLISGSIADDKILGERQYHDKL